MLKTLEEKFRLYFPKHLKTKNRYINAIKGLKGIEIGGPSFTFSNQGLLPLYTKIDSLDGCNFSNNTIWEGDLNAGFTYQYLKDKKPGTQYITEGNDLKDIMDNTYDFVLSCHNLEHFANPIKALYEWKRVMKNGGFLILVLPNKEKTFDHKRPTTPLDHLLKDYKDNISEYDDTHFEEVIKLHDISMDAGVSSTDELRNRTYKNFENRCVHHHVFDQSLVYNMLSETAFEIISLDLIQINIFALAKSIK